MTDQENNAFKVIDVHEAKTMIDAQDVQIIDSREADEHESGHVPDSINIPHMETFNKKSVKMDTTESPRTVSPNN